MVKEESEKSDLVDDGVQLSQESRISHANDDSKGSFWNSYPIENLTPEQRKHFKEVMRKEVRK